MTDPGRELGRRLAAMERRLDRHDQALRRRSLPSSSLDGGRLVVRDAAGNTRQVIGRQDDGTYGQQHRNGPPPSAPTTPQISEALGGLTVRWDGRLIERLPADFAFVAIHLSAQGSTFSPTSENRVGVLFAAGEFPAVPLPYTQHWVKLVAYNTSGKRSVPSTVASGTPVQVVQGDLGPGSITETEIADDAITTPKLAAEAVTANELAADSVLAGKIAANAVTAGTIQAGAVEAAHLAAQLVLSQTLQSPNYDPEAPTGTPGYVITPDYAEFHNVYTDGSAKGTSGSYDRLSAQESFTYMGDELRDVLSQTATGIVAFGYADYNSDVATTAEFEWFEVSFEAIADHEYVVNVAGFISRDNPTILTVRYTTDGSRPNTFDPPFLDVETPRNMSNVFSMEFYPNVTGTVRLVVTNKSRYSGDSSYIGPALGTCRLWVEDHGGGGHVHNSAIKRSSGSNTGTTPPGGDEPTKTYYQQRTYTNYSITYQGNGSTFEENGRCYQGQSPYGPNGNQYSRIAIPNSGMIDSLAGVPDSDITYLELELLFPHWYFGDGGTAVIGYYDTNQASHPDQLRLHFNRGQRKWVNLRGTGIATAIRQGTFNGITLGPGPNSSYEYYGYANGNTQSYEPSIRCGYYK